MSFKPPVARVELCARRWSSLAVALVAAAAIAIGLTASRSAAAAEAGACAFDYLGQAIVPTGSTFEGVEFGGLSGLDRDPRSGLYWSISDDRGYNGPVRMYQLSLDLAKMVRSNNAGHDALSVRRMVVLVEGNGDRYRRLEYDPEAIRLLPDGQLVFAHEGRRSPLGNRSPGVRIIDDNGRRLNDFTVPSKFRPIGRISGEGDDDRGVRDNLGFESLALTPDGKRLYVAVENALVQDGPKAGPDVSSPSRVIEYDTQSRQPLAEFVYEVEPWPTRPLGILGRADNGLAEMLALRERRLLMLERSYTTGAGVRIKLYLADARAATDVSGLPSLAEAVYQPATKRLVLELSDLRNDDGSAIWLDNIESISLGPKLADGRDTLVFVSDNNFSSFQATQFIAVAVRDWQALLDGDAGGVCRR